MATVTHYIRSSYSPSQRDRLLRETGQPVASTSRSPSPHPNPRRTENEEDLDRAWRTESTFGGQRRITRVPRFVKARVQYDEFGNIIGGWEGLFDDEDNDRRKGGGEVKEPDPEKGVAGWYRALMAAREKRAEELDRLEKGEYPAEMMDGAAPGLGSRQDKEQRTGIHVSGTQVSSSNLAPLVPATTDTAPPQPAAQSTARYGQRTNWFTSRPLSFTPTVRSTPTLADILARNPPPDATSTSVKERPFKPPVFLHLTPSNIGWRMLEQSGWREGEGLGANVKRRNVKVQGKRPEGDKLVEIVDVDEFVEHEERKGHVVEVIDLTGDDDHVDTVEEDVDHVTEAGQDERDATLSGSDDEAEEAEEDEDEDSFEPDPTRTTLLTPLPTVLKADKLGIGLHHRRVRRKQAKKVTHKHTSEAMKDHIKRGEEIQRKQREVGRGRRGFEKIRRREEDERRRLIGYLNS
ncbi:hypothetical protein OE88DRAFT_1394452 [Heliocybe sulcata]|uniref:G-patch domain-containing protein n=1 Tax=Heliocybe sulcata TaxID=5364 RepID=A0A5C3N5P6_9AGAM|nr:hypothetical protein OE88DRAFT_1394452 [Heliocybe sulcata]